MLGFVGVHVHNIWLASCHASVVACYMADPSFRLLHLLISRLLKIIND